MSCVVSHGCRSSEPTFYMIYRSVSKTCFYTGCKTGSWCRSNCTSGLESLTILITILMWKLYTVWCVKFYGVDEDVADLASPWRYRGFCYSAVWSYDVHLVLLQIFASSGPDMKPRYVSKVSGSIWWKWRRSLLAVGGQAGWEHCRSGWVVT